MGEYRGGKRHGKFTSFDSYYHGHMDNNVIYDENHAIGRKYFKINYNYENFLPTISLPKGSRSMDGGGADHFLSELKQMI